MQVSDMYSITTLGRDGVKAQLASALRFCFELNQSSVVLMPGEIEQVSGTQFKQTEYSLPDSFKVDIQTYWTTTLCRLV